MTMENTGAPADDLDNVLGFDDQYGDDPFKAPSGNPHFNPAYFTLVVIRIRTDLKMDAAHASYPIPPGDLDSYVIGKLGRMSVDASKPIEMPADPYPGSVGKDLINIGFGSERKIYVYVINPTLSFVPTRGIRFTKYGSDGVKKDKNKSFYNARIISMTAGLGPLLYVENYYRDETGGPNGPTDRMYSMNFLLNMATPAGGYIPLIIDPGTGNGGAWRP
jgi:hypothetical protein